jgi:hypothetical protein
MPYVKQERRPALDKVIDELVKLNRQSGDITLFLLKLSRSQIKGFVTQAKRLEKALTQALYSKVEPNGDINYILFKYCKYYVKPSYNNYKSFMGEIYTALSLFDIRSRSYIDEYREAAEWIRIKLLTPYEEEKIIENGDV